MLDIKFANKDKSLDEGNWIIDYNYLESISEKLEEAFYSKDLETIEAILLIANGDYELWKDSMELIGKM